MLCCAYPPTQPKLISREEGSALASLRAIHERTQTCGSPHGTVHFYYRRRCFVARKGFGIRRPWRTLAGAGLFGPFAQARPLSQR